MGISSRRALGWLYRAAMDSSPLRWVFSWACSLRLDIPSRLGNSDDAGCLCRKSGPSARAGLYIASSLGRSVLRLCLASDLVCCLRYGNPPAWPHYPFCTWQPHWWLASLLDAGISRGPKYLGPPGWFNSARPHPIRCPVIGADLALAGGSDPENSHGFWIFVSSLS